MCGLVGALGALSVKHESVVKTLLEVDTIRGPHSTGLLVVDRLEETKLAKHVGTPWDLYQFHGFKSAVSGVNRLMMGHNRWATKGGITNMTAHPFEFPTLIGAHNGTLRRQWELDDSKNFAVDSENLYYHMDRNGLDDTLEKTDGSFALTWYNKTSNTMNFIRNHERTLFYTYSDCGVLFWASEEWMLLVSLSKHKVSHGKIQAFEERTHYEVAVDAHIVKPVLQLYITSKADLKPAPVVYQNYNQGGYKHGGGWSQKNYKGGAANNSNGNKAVVEPTFNWDGRLLTACEWHKKANKSPCAWCSERLSIVHHEEHVWTLGGDTVCASCAKDDQVKDFLP